jgi:Asp-tRNA(Asn)/Glu-tRNA(Gln) amidotransferase C subunit
VRRKVAELEAAVAQADAAELARVPQISARAGYTRLSFIAPFVFAIPGGPAPPAGMGLAITSLQNVYLGEAQLVVPLSDYVLRYPKLIETARLGAEVARIDKRSSEVTAGQDARLTYYEWVRARLQVVISRRQLVQVQTTLAQVRALAEAQRLSRADLLRVESQEAEAEQVVDQLENLSQLREEQLRLLIGAPATEPLAVGEDIRGDVAASRAARLDDLMGTAKQHRLEFKAIDTGIQAKESQRAAEKANLFPPAVRVRRRGLCRSEPAGVPAEGRVQAHVVGRRPADLDAQRRAGVADRGPPDRRRGQRAPRRPRQPRARHADRGLARPAGDRDRHGYRYITGPRAPCLSVGSDVGQSCRLRRQLP